MFMLLMRVCTCMCVRARLRAVSEEKVFTAVMAKHLSLSFFFFLSLWLRMYGNSTMTSTWYSIRVFSCARAHVRRAQTWTETGVLWFSLATGGRYDHVLRIPKSSLCLFFGIQLQNNNQYLNVLDTVFVSLVLFCSAYLAQWAWSFCEFMSFKSVQVPMSSGQNTLQLQKRGLSVEGLTNTEYKNHTSVSTHGQSSLDISVALHASLALLTECWSDLLQ